MHNGLSGAEQTGSEGRGTEGLFAGFRNAANTLEHV